MTAEEISRINEHIEMHARREPASVKITEILHRAVAELERIAELEKENAELKVAVDFQTSCNMSRYFQLNKLKEQLAKAKVNTTTISDYPDKLVWHKIADGDLPPIYTTVLDGNGDRVELDEHGKWQTYSEYYERYEEIDPPKVWCEIPKYTEE